MAHLDAVTMLDEEHNAAIRLLEQYKTARQDPQRELLAMQVCRELETHMQLEEEIFYPAYRKATQDEEVLQDSIEEHEEARKLMAKVRDDRLNARLMLELENAILHHVNDEREKMFPKARDARNLDLRALAREMEARKAELTEGYPA